MKSDKIILSMIERNLIPSSGLFEVTLELTEAFHNIYRELFPPKSNKKLKASDINYYKKLAGINLMKLSISREIVETTTKYSKPRLKCGIIYIVSNPVYPGLYKIGVTQDLDKRLSQYQTADPHRGFKVEHSRFVEDRFLEEKRYLSLFNTDIVNGEWINSNKIKTIFIKDNFI